MLQRLTLQQKILPPFTKISYIKRQLEDQQMNCCYLIDAQQPIKNIIINKTKRQIRNKHFQHLIKIIKVSKMYMQHHNKSNTIMGCLSQLQNMKRHQNNLDSIYKNRYKTTHQRTGSIERDSLLNGNEGTSMETKIKNWQTVSPKACLRQSQTYHIGSISCNTHRNRNQNLLHSSHHNHKYTTTCIDFEREEKNRKLSTLLKNSRIARNNMKDRQIFKQNQKFVRRLINVKSELQPYNQPCAEYQSEAAQDILYPVRRKTQPQPYPPSYPYPQPTTQYLLDRCNQAQKEYLAQTTNLSAYNTQSYRPASVPIGQPLSYNRHFNSNSSSHIGGNYRAKIKSSSAVNRSKNNKRIQLQNQKLKNRLLTAMGSSNYSQDRLKMNINNKYERNERTFSHSYYKNQSKWQSQKYKIEDEHNQADRLEQLTSKNTKTQKNPIQYDQPAKNRTTSKKKPCNQLTQLYDQAIKYVQNQQYKQKQKQPIQKLQTSKQKKVDKSISEKFRLSYGKVKRSNERNRQDNSFSSTNVNHQKSIANAMKIGSKQKQTASMQKMRKAAMLHFRKIQKLKVTQSRLWQVPTWRNNHAMPTQTNQIQNQINNMDKFMLTQPS